MSSEPIIELRGVRALRGGYEALRGVSLAFPEGEASFVMGGAGSGKSVLLKTAAGLLLPSVGEVLYKGRPLDRMSPREEAVFRRATGFVFQDAALWANQSLFDNLALPVRVHEGSLGKAEVERAVRRAAELVGFAEDLHVRPAELSSGERRLIGLARALVLDPELVFMDDPEADLDEEAAERALGIIAALKERGRSLVVVGSSSDCASRFADRVAALKDGLVLAAGTYDEAAAWTDPAVRAVTGRLKSRRDERPEWATGPAGDWARAFAEDSFAIPESAAASGGAGPGGALADLGDIINDVPGAEGEAREKDEE
jgi:phospholipid/cholesterol/gamma-HCH transport system ATP-binding protein